tara:strand:+ start:56 stop:556 length:501 start_codon:yes stop_codon:yes gene_type:complete
MTNRADQIGTREWLEENNRRVIFQNHMYKCAGRDNPDHPMHGLFTGLWHDFCINEAGKAQRDGWFERLEFLQKVESGEIEIPKPHYYNSEGEIPRPEEEVANDFNVSNTPDPVDEYLNCSAECDINDQECEDICIEELKKPVIEEFNNFSVGQADSPHQAAIATND